MLLRDGPVRVDADHLAQVARGVLRGIEPHPLAGEDEELAVRGEHQRPAEVAAPDRLRYLAPDHLHVPERGPVQAPARDRAALEDVVLLVEVPAEARVRLVAGAGELLLGCLGIRMVEVALPVWAKAIAGRTTAANAARAKRLMAWLQLWVTDEDIARGGYSDVGCTLATLPSGARSKSQ